MSEYEYGVRYPDGEVIVYPSVYKAKYENAMHNHFTRQTSRVVRRQKLGWEDAE
jgi:hypothetical protein